MGKAEGPLSATVRWPSGVAQTFHALPVNHRIEMEEGVEAVVAKEDAADLGHSICSWPAVTEDLETAMAVAAYGVRRPWGRRVALRGAPTADKRWTGQVSAGHAGEAHA